MAAVHAPAFHIAGAHPHTATDRCPWCDQAVPHEKFAEIKSRIAAKEREQHEEVTNRLKEEFAREKAETEARAREEGRKAAEAAIEARLATAEAARTAADAARTAAETALQAEREALEKAKTVAVLAEQAKAFEERQKLQEKVLGLQKQLENKTAQELGEGPEVDLFEQLKAAFEGDRLRRVLKGAQGADVIHEIVHKGQVCGKIIYDSKNRNAWKSEFVTKLRADQLAERAEHAVLSSNKFPAGTQQLHIQDGVIIAHPGRVDRRCRDPAPPHPADPRAQDQQRRTRGKDRGALRVHHLRPLQAAPRADGDADEPHARARDRRGEGAPRHLGAPQQAHSPRAQSARRPLL